MPKFVAFLRAINVGGRVVSMAALLGHFEALGLAEVETFIASGNVIFASKIRDTKALQARIEEQLAQVLGYEVAVFLRTCAEIAHIARHRAFDEAEVAAGTAFNVAFLADRIGPNAEARILQFKTEIDDFHVHGREVYWLCKKKQSDSKFSNRIFEKALGLRATFRGMATVRKLAEKYPV